MVAREQMAGFVDERRMEAHTLQPHRWYVLLFFCMYSFNQCYTWFSFASTSQATMQAYFGTGMTKGTIDMLLNWGPIAGVLAFIPQTWIMSQRDGLRRGLWIGMLLTLAANVIRTTPLIVAHINEDKLFPQSDVAFLMYHIGQFLNALSGPFCMGSCTLLSCVWFAEKERTKATAIAQTANGFGTVIGFLNPVVLAVDPVGVPSIFYLGLVLAIIPCICASLYFPPRPLHFPSAAAEALCAASLHQAQEHPQTSAGLHEFTRHGETRRGLLSFFLLIFAVGLNSGILNGWQGCLQSILNPLGISDKVVGYIGFSNGLAANIAAVLGGSMADGCFQRRLKLGILVGVLGQLLSLGWFALSLPSVLFDVAPLGHTDASLVIAVAAAGLFQGGTTPLYYELAAELLYPRRESTSAGILVLITNSACLLTIQVNSMVAPSNMNLLAVFGMAGVLLCVAAVYEKYGRPRDVTLTCERA